MTKTTVKNVMATALITAGVGAAISTLGLFFWYSHDLPSPERVKRREGFSTVVLDRSGDPLYDIYSEKNRIPVPLSDIPKSLREATIAIEDKDFYKHQGFSLTGTARALINILTFRGLQGGSTLTQQLVKNVLLTTERTLPRKIKEFILALQIERKYSKDEILQMYLNEAPYGGTMWGIEAAAQGYFGKHVNDLSFLESVVLAGFPQRPSYYSPFLSEDRAYIGRSEEVLRRMREDGYITLLQEAESKNVLSSLTFASESAQLKAVHFVLYVKKQLTERFGEDIVAKGGLRVTTTIDGKLQEKAEQIVREELNEIENLNVTNGAVVVIDPTNGEILSYIGSKTYEGEDDEFQGKFDVASMGLRQPGSALKPITYAVAFQKGYTPASLIMDVETHFPAGEGKPDYIPKNYDLKHRGPVQVRFALANSINIPAVKITALVGIRDILKTAYDMGLETLEPTDENIQRLGLSITLGGGEVRLLDLTRSYGVLATGGIRNETVSILKVVDSSGSVLYEHPPVSGKRVLAEDVSFLVSHILQDNEARKDVFGTRSYLVIPGKTVSVKTGTTDDKRDNWTVGYTPSIVVGVWVGNNDNSEMNPKIASGVTGAAPIWNRIMREALEGKQNEELRKPETVTSLDIDAFAGGLPKEGRPTRLEYFIKGTEPTSVSSIYTKIKISRADSGKLANAIERATGAYEEKEFIVFEEVDPTSLDQAVNKWHEGIDAWVKDQGDEAYHPPKEEAKTDEDKVVVTIKKPENETQVEDNQVKIEATATALMDIKKMELIVDDGVKSSVQANRIEETLNLATGVHTIRVKAYDEKGNTGQSEVKIGVKTSPTALSPTTVPSPLPSLSPTPPLPI